jgi:caspase domain-containing protein/Sel1 repeat-containing protein
MSRGGLATVTIRLQVALFAIALACGVANAADNRVALVVGNADYQQAPHLATPANDAQDIAAVLTGLGFDVILRQNTGATDLRRSFQDFSEKSAHAAIAIVYFAGYGVGAGTEGFLVPVDAGLSTAASFQSEAVPVQSALLAVAKARSLGLVILDAMRGNPFSPRIARAEPSAEQAAPAATVASNVLVFFATEPGKTASEGEGRNSPLAAALLKFLPAPDLEINFLLRNVRDDVRKSTRQKQTPYMYGQLSGAKIFINEVAALKQASLTSPRADPAAIQPCDKLASAPEDTSKRRGLGGVKLEDIKPDDAVKACSDAIKQYPGVDRFHYQLGRSLFAQKNYPAAVDSYKRAYDLGNTRALYALGAMYDDGTGVDKDPARARFYYEIAAQLKFAPAIVALAGQYERGSGTAVDLAKALSLYQQAADLGDLGAINKLGIFNEKGLGLAANVAKARSYYEKAAGLGNDEAMVNLARCYANGIGGKQDLGEARRLLTKAAQAGSLEAKRILARVDAAGRK